MNFRISVALLFSYFLFQSIYAQDSKISKHKIQHGTKKSVSDSAKPVTKKKESYIKDTASKHVAKTPKYPRDGYVAISRGLAIPNNSFASTGNAANGKIYSVAVAFPGIISHAGIAFKFDHGINGINEIQLQESLNQQVQGSFQNIICSPAGAIGQYYYSTLLTGLYLTYPSKHITVDARILVGVMFANMPSLTINYYDQNSKNTADYTQSESSGNAFAFDMGIEIRYAVVPRLCVILSADYLTASPSFNNITTGAGLSPNGVIMEENGRETTLSQSLDLSNFSLGIGYVISAQKHSGSNLH